MSFAVPTALLLAGLALPIILLYILKVRLRRVNVSTNLFWKQIYEEKPPRSIWQYFRHLISLLLQLLILALLVCSVADPYFPWQLLQARRIVAVIDNSASMQADDLHPTRFNAAIDSAITLVDGLRFRDEMAIVLSGPRPEVVLGMSSHAPTLKRALRELKVSDNPTELATAIGLGKKLLGAHPRGQVVVFTDGCDQDTTELDSAIPSAAQSAIELASDNAAELGTATQIATTSNGEVPTENSKDTVPSVDYRIFASRTGNVGITQFQVRRSLIDPIGYEVLVAVHNASDDPVECRLEIELDEAVVDVIPLTLDSNQHWSRSLEKTSLQGGRLVGTLNQFTSTKAAKTATAQANGASNSNNTNTPAQGPTDARPQLNGLTRDDVATAILPPREVQNVLVVTKGNLFLRKVFEANPLVNVTVLPDFPDTWPSDTIVVFDRQVPDVLPAGNVFVVDPDGSCDLWELGEPLRDPIVTEQDEGSQLMKHVRLDNVLMPEARKVTFKGKPHVLAGSISNDPVYASLTRENGKCLLLTVNLDRSDLAFRTAFPIMVTNALGWFAGTSGELRQASRTGDLVIADLTEHKNKHASESLSLMSPSGVIMQVALPETQVSTSAADPGSQDDSATEDKMLSLGPFDECGVWSLVESAQSTETKSPAAGTEDANIDGGTGNDRIAEFAVNLSDSRESDLRPPKELLEDRETKPLIASLFARPIWFYLVAVGCLVSIVEWFLYQRRVIS